MKKILIVVAIIVIAIVLIFVKDPEARKADDVASIYDNIILKNSVAAVAACDAMNKTIQSLQPGERSDTLNQQYKNMILAWKKVEATYVLGELNPDFIDTPRFIDYFHVGKASLKDQMMNIINSNDSPETALFKSSFQSVNALDIVLYHNSSLSPRDIALAKVIAPSICDYIKQINDGYHQARQDFVSSPQKVLQMLANVLANQTFALKDWRIGDVAGLTIKYKGIPSYDRSEYALSHLSMPAIITILETQKQLIGKQDYANLGDLIEDYGASKQLEETRVLLDNTLTAAKQANTKDFEFQPEKTKPLYNAADALQKEYYNGLLHALPVVAKILEADGD